MRIGKREIVIGPAVLSATRPGRPLVEALESRTLLSGAALAAASAQIDLSGSFSKLVSSARAGKKYVETIKVSNAGSSLLPGLLPIQVDTSPDQFLADGTKLTTINKSIKLKPGKSVKIALNLTAPAEASSFYLVIQLDPNNTLGTNLANNVFASAAKVNVATGPFKKGSIIGQHGWRGFNTASSPSSTAVVSTSVKPPSGDKYAIVLDRSVGDDIGVAPPTTITSATPFTVTAQVEVNYKTVANGPFFGLNLYGDNGAVEIGTLGVSAADGNIYDSASGAGEFLLSDGSAGSPAAVAAGTWNTFKIVADFAGGVGGPVTLNYYVNNVLVDNETTTASVTSFSYAYIWGQEGFTATTDTAGTAAFDNYSLTTTAASTLPAKGLTFP